MFKDLIQKFKEMPENERKKKIWLIAGIAFGLALLLNLLFGK